MTGSSQGPGAATAVAGAAAAALGPFAAAGVLDPLSVRFAEALARLEGLGAAPGAEVLIGAAAASAAVTRGHVCVALSRAARLLPPEEAAMARAAARGEAVVAPAWPEAGAWREALAASPLVGDGGRLTPLVLVGERLYLHRYWRYERRLVEALARRADPAAGGLVEGVDEAGLAAALDALFGVRGPGEAPDMQRVAAERAVRRRLAIITGGPGTGKTSTVVRVLAALIEQAIGEPGRGGGAAPSVLLLAPTGKAAARMSEAVREAKAAFTERAADAAAAAAAGLDERVRAAIPEEASTIHRALGFPPGSPTRYVHGRDYPLAADVVIVDEASMVDLALMAKLVDAVRDDARLVLLGDEDQLASVEAGNVLGELCASPRLEACRVGLVESHRFGPDSGIAALARAINAGDADGAMALLRDGARADVALVEPAAEARGDLEGVLRPLVAPALEARAAEREPAAALAALGRFQLLAAHRRGALGAAALNAAAERWLVEAGAIALGGGGVDALAYAGRPVMVTTNDYTLGLFNGDTGVVLRDAASGALRVFLPDTRTGGIRSLTPAQLPPHETFYATTVHKGQGSGYDEVVVALPLEASPILTRELLYTAVTRARRKVTLVGPEAVIRHAVTTRVERASGLSAALADAGGWNLPAPAP